MHEIPCNWRTKLFLFCRCCSGDLFFYDALLLAHVDRQRGDSAVTIFGGVEKYVIGVCLMFGDIKKLL